MSRVASGAGPDVIFDPGKPRRGHGPTLAGWEPTPISTFSKRGSDGEPVVTPLATATLYLSLKIEEQAGAALAAPQLCLNTIWSHFLLDYLNFQPFQTLLLLRSACGNSRRS